MVREVVAKLIGEHACFAVEILRAEAEREDIYVRANRFDDVAVWVVHVLRSNRAGFRHITHDVAVVVITGDEEGPIDGYGKKSTDSSRALFRAGQVIAPEVFAGMGRAIDEHDPFEDDVHVVPNKSMRFARLPLLAVEPLDTLHNAAVLVVVGVDHREVALGRRYRA